MGSEAIQNTRLKGMGWDHKRCMTPLLASIDEYRRHRPDLAISWDTRPLAHFGDGDLEELLDYDLIIFDHPYSGQIAREGWFYNFAELLDEKQQRVFADDSLGPCWESYQADGGIWGLPIDAAAQMASCRPDLMDRLDAAIPQNLDDVIRLGEKARSRDMYIGFPYVAIDSICTFLTLSANAGLPVSRDKTWFPEHNDTVRILEAIKRIADLAHPGSRDWNPIRCYDHMSVEDDVCYVPYAFNYSNYARAGREKPVVFHDIPGLESDSCRGALLGGAGIGISKRCDNPQAALEYACFLCSPEYQAGTYFRNEGQPASLTAWTSSDNDAEANRFFSNTLETMQQSYLRPTFNGYIRHFREAGPRIRDYLAGNDDVSALADWLRRDYFS